MNGTNKQNTAINVNTESNNNWKSKLNKRSYSGLVLVLIISLIINFNSPFFTIVSYADYVVSGNYVDYFEEGNLNAFIGNWCAKLGYFLDGYENTQIFSNLFMQIADDYLKDYELASLIPDYDAKSAVDNAKLFNILIEKGDIIIDQGSQNLQVSASLNQLLYDYISTSPEAEDLTSYILISTLTPEDLPITYCPADLYPILSESVNSLSSDQIAFFSRSKPWATNYQYNRVTLSNNFFTINKDNAASNTLIDFKSSYVRFKNDLQVDSYADNYTPSYILNYDTGSEYWISPDWVSQAGEIIYNHWNIISDSFIPWIGGRYNTNVLLTSKPIKLPVFKNMQAYYDYVKGKAALYILDNGYSGGSVTIDPSIDPQEVYNAISDAIKDSGLNDTTAIQDLINKVASDYLNKIADATISTSENTAKIVENTKGILEASQKTLDKLDKIYEELKSFHTDSNKHFTDSIDKYLKKISDKLESGLTGTGGNVIDSDTLISISSNISDVFSVVINPVSINVVQRGLDLDVQLHDLIDHTNNQITVIDVGFQELIKQNKDKFPVCIPSDMLYMYSLFAAKPEAPHFDLPIKYKGISDQNIEIDLSGWGTLSKISRGFFSILFIAGLIPLTFKILDYNEKFFERR